MRLSKGFIMPELSCALFLVASGIIAGTAADITDAGTELSALDGKTLLAVAVVALCIVLLWIVRRVMSSHDGLVAMIQAKSQTDAIMSEAIKSQTAVNVEVKDTLIKVNESMEWCRKSQIERINEAHREAMP